MKNAYNSVQKNDFPLGRRGQIISVGYILRVAGEKGIPSMQLNGRRAGSGFVVCMFMLVAAVLASAKAQTIDLRMSTIPTLDNAAFEAGLAKNYFRDEGLKIETTPTVGGSAGIPALVSGQLQAASSNVVSIILAAARGLEPVMVIAGDTTRDEPPDLLGIACKKGCGSRSGKDLEGKTIAVNARNNIPWLYAREWIAKTGGDPAKVTFTEIPFPQMIDALQNDRVAAATVVEPYLSAALDAGVIDVVGWPYSAIQKRLPVAQFVMTKTYADQHRDVVDRVIRAYNRSVDWTNDNLQSEEFLQIVSGYTKIAPDRLRRVSRPAYVKTIDPASIRAVELLMKKHGLIDTDVDVSAMIYPSLVAQ
jgi:NitT/TauT family transport system substrate-binding protein